MGIGRLIGVFALIPASALLAVSFFVLFAARKAGEKGLKLFGYTTAGLLWVAVLLVVSSGVYTLSTGRCLLMRTMQGMMKNQSMMMGGKMMQGQKEMMMQDKTQGAAGQGQKQDASGYGAMREQ